MKVSELKLIYKDSIISDTPSLEDLFYNYYDGQHYLHIPKNNLNGHEMLLLESMTKNYSNQSLWHKFLTSDSKEVPVNNYDVQCIHFHVKKVKNNKQQWLNSFKSYFEKVYDAFFIGDDHGVVVLEMNKKNNLELSGFIDMLDDDFSTITSIFVGFNCNIENVKDVFNEEQVLFQSHQKSGQVINYLDVYLAYYIAPKLEDSFIGKQLKQNIMNDNDLVDLIEGLWFNQGNLTLTAKTMFIHRNTLNYRIERILSKYNIDLKDGQQLLLCYLLII